MSEIKEMNYVLRTSIPLTAEQLLSDIHPLLINGERHLPDREESIHKLRALLTLLLTIDNVTADDDEGDGFVPHETVSWALILALDLVDEVFSRVRNSEDNAIKTWKEMQRRLDGFILSPIRNKNPTD